MNSDVGNLCLIVALVLDRIADGDQPVSFLRLSFCPVRWSCWIMGKWSPPDNPLVSSEDLDLVVALPFLSHLGQVPLLPCST